MLYMVREQYGNSVPFPKGERENRRRKKGRGKGIGMVGPLKYYRRDPNGKGRGPGYYYHRGHGYYSKFSRLANQRHSDRVGAKGRRRWWRKGKIGSGPYKHTHDRRVKSKKSKSKKRSGGGGR